MLPRSALSALLVFTLAGAGACGDDGGGDGDDQALADRIVLTEADVPEGFVAEPESEPEEDDEGEDEEDDLSACVGAEGIGDDTVDAESPTFSKGQESQLSSFASVFDDEGDATEAFDLVQSEVFGDCVQDLLRSSIQAEIDADSGLTLGAIELEDSEAPDVGDDATALRFTLPISASGLELVAFVDFVLFREGRVVGGLFGFNLGEPFDASAVADLTELMAGRAAA